MGNMSETLGKKIKRLYEEKGYDQQTFSQKSGIPQPTLSNIENDRRMPRRKTLEKIAKSLDTTVEKLFNETGTREGTVKWELPLLGKIADKLPVEGELQMHPVLASQWKENRILYTIPDDGLSPTYFEGDIVAADHSTDLTHEISLKQATNRPCACKLNGKDIFRVVRQVQGKIVLDPTNKEYEPKEVKPNDDFHVRAVIKRLIDREGPKYL
jgi:transcriptional regulator with XRE-family HTH domain